MATIDTDVTSIQISKGNVGGLTEIPDYLRLCKRLKFLDLRMNLIETVPGWLGELMDLEDLDLQMNFIDHFPDCIGSLSNLKKLNISRNNSMFDSNGKSRENTTVSELIYKLEKLEWLDMSFNTIEVLPQVINLPNLSYLDISRNNLRCLPESVGLLKSLTFLNVSINSLIHIPEFIVKLTKLEHFDVSHNDVLEYPTFVKEMKNVKKFITTGNYALNNYCDCEDINGDCDQQYCKLKKLLYLQSLSLHDAMDRIELCLLPESTMNNSCHIDNPSIR